MSVGPTWGATKAFAACAVALALAPATRALADGRYCERVDATCWRCANITFPAEIPCTTPSVCDPATTLCVDQSGVTTCFAPTPYCCPSFPCEIPIGCSGAASSCGDTDGDGRNDQCTFLSDCPDGGTSDAGSSDARASDAGTSDGGTTDAGTTDAGTSDAGALDAGTPDAATPDAGMPDGGRMLDASAPMDAGSPLDAGGPPRTDDGGCGCAVPGGRARSLAPLSLSVAGVLAAVKLRRRRSRPAGD